MKTYLHNLIKIIILILLLVIIFLLGRCSVKHSSEPNLSSSDTVFIHSKDTITIKKDSIIEHTRTLQIIDTVIVKDTILLVENKLYQDSFSNIWFSGINAEIDSIRYFIPTDTVFITETVTNKRSRWTISVQTGVGAQYGLIHKQLDLGPYIGVGVSYNFQLKRASRN